MTEMPLLTSLLLLLILSRVLGQIFERFRQPALVGEMLAGVILGPSILDVIHANAALSGISELAIFLIVLSAGLEMKFADVANVLRSRGLIVGLLGFGIPLFSGILVGVLFRMDVMRTVFLALCISITALPVAVRILQNFRLLDSRIARYAIATAILNDVVALLALGVILNIPAQRSFQAVALSVLSGAGKLVLLAGVILGFNYFLQRARRAGRDIQAIPERLAITFGNETVFGILVLFVLAFGVLSELLGFHFVIGAFFGALLLDKRFFLPSRYQEVEKTLSSVTGGFLAPVFFAYLGLEFQISEISSVAFAVVVLLVSIGSKILAGWLGGRAIRLPPEEALGVGVILNGRGVMELVVAGIAYERGFIGVGLFSTLVLMGAVTTLITPLLFRRWVMPRLPQMVSDNNGG